MSLDRAEVLLGQQKGRWKLANSLWIVVVFVGIGIFSVIGWLWAGSIAHSPKVWRVVRIWCGITVVVVIAVTISGIAGGPDGKDVEPWSTIAAILMGTAWLGGTAHAALLARTVLRERALYLDNLATATAQFRSQVPTPIPTAAASTAAAPASLLGIGQGDYYSPRPDAAPASFAPPAAQAVEASPAQRTGDPVQPNPAQPAAMVDLNSAPEQTIALLPRLDPTAASSIVAARRVKGGFRDFTDFVASTGLQPHQVAELQDKVTFGPFQPPAPPVGGTGRVLDI